MARRPQPRIRRPARLQASKPRSQQHQHAIVAPAPHPRAVTEHILETPQASVLDVFDELLNKGVMANGELTLGVAGIDLIYLRLSALLCAADRVLPADRKRPPTRRRR
jgi:hypothetical protein